MKHESMRYGYVLVHFIRTVAFLVLIAGILSSAIALWVYMVPNEVIKVKAINAINDNEQAEYKRNQFEFDKACQAAKEKHEALEQGLREISKVLQEKGAIMHREVARYDSSCEPYEPVEQALSSDNIEQIEQGIKSLVALEDSYKNVMTITLSSNFNEMIALLRKNMEGLQEKLAEDERKLAALKDKYKPIKKEVRTMETVTKQPNLSTIQTLYGNLGQGEVKGHVKKVRSDMPILTDLQSFTNEGNIRYSVNIKEAGDKLVRWLPATPPPSVEVVPKINYVEEEPQWSVEDALQRDLLTSSIQRSKDEIQNLKNKISELESRRDNSVASIDSEWEIEALLQSALNIMREYNEFVVADAIEQARKAKEAADRETAEDAKMGRNMARRAFIRSTLNFVLLPLGGVVGAWMSWLLLMIIADFTACPLVIALRTQSLDEK